MKSLQDRVGSWGDVTFPASTPMSVVDHLRDEVEEIGAAIFDAPGEGVAPDGQISSEAADCLLLLFQVAHKCGFDLIAEAERKFVINQARTWGEPDARGVVRHVEEGE